MLLMPPVPANDIKAGPVDRLSEGFRPYLLLSLLCLLLYMPGLATVPPLDRDESRFVQATRQMLESGDFVRIQYQNEMRAKKPVGAYWLQAASVSLFSDAKATALWPYRLPSALAAWAAVLMTFAFGSHLFGRQAALLGAALLGSCLMLVAEGHQAKTDAVLLACVVAAQGALARTYLGRGGILVALAFWLAQGIGILVKGPIVPLMSLLTIATLVIADRRAGWLVALRPLTGVLVTIAVAAPWFAAINQATGGTFVDEAVKGDLLPKLLGAHESHGGKPGFYLLLASATFWPASALAWPALVHAWRQRLRPEVRFCLAWIIPAWILFELIPTKLPHYVMPTYPALALLTAAAVMQGAPVLSSRGAKAWYAVWGLVGLALAVATVVAPMRLGEGFSLFSVPGAMGIAGATLLAVWLARRGRARTAAVALVATAACTFPVLFDGVLPSLDKMWISRTVAAQVASIGRAAPVAIAGYSEPSLVFLLGTDTMITTGSGAAGHLVAAPGSLAVVSETEAEDFAATAAALGYQPTPLAIVKGFHYSRGKPAALTIYAKMREP